jgi:hypothetical protein
MSLTIEAGKYYEDSNGAVVGPMGRGWAGWAGEVVRGEVLSVASAAGPAGPLKVAWYSNEGVFGGTQEPRGRDLFREVPWPGAATAPTAHDCARLGHDFIDNGTLRTECRHCRADGHWNREYAVYLGVP